MKQKVVADATANFRLKTKKTKQYEDNKDKNPKGKLKRTEQSVGDNLKEAASAKAGRKAAFDCIW